MFQGREVCAVLDVIIATPSTSGFSDIILNFSNRSNGANRIAEPVIVTVSSRSVEVVTQFWLLPAVGCGGADGAFK